MRSFHRNRLGHYCGGHLDRVLLIVVVLFAATTTVVKAISETDRLQEYHARNYTWPPKYVTPNTEGWRRNMFRRLAQVERIESYDDRYNGWVASMSMALSVPNFTENGWGLARAPPHIVEELRQSLHNGLSTAKTETFINVIEGEGDERPLFITQKALNDRIMEELKPMHEAWSGVKLEGSMAYGLRVYRNNSSLYMHVDKLRTHVISCILHVDHSEDSEPWPILIEDYHGNTNEVTLESGDMLFYESSKCIHGRPKKLNGSWYSSLFVHYHPVGWDMEKAEMENHYTIPAHWHKTEPRDPRLENLVMVGTSMIEPECPHKWCGTDDTIKWKGPGIDGVVISTGFQYPNEAA